MTRILHITPHLGGDVGTVVLNYVSNSQHTGNLNHTICCLEDVNLLARERAASEGICLHQNMGSNIEDLLEQIADTDLVLIHWWNHPLLYSLLVNEKFPAARVIIWSHVNGHAAPQVFTEELIDFPDLFVIASPYSWQAPAIEKLTDRNRAARVRLVFSSAGTEHLQTIQAIPHTDFRVGYIGTVDYCKMHVDYLRLSCTADVPGIHFPVCGGKNHELICAQAAEMGVGDKFQFFGQVTDIKKYLAKFDVFGYPLNPTHYGTGEQVIIEALAAGVPPVVLNHSAESFVVQDGINGLVVDDPEDYPRALELLYNNLELRRKLASNARESVRDRYSIDTTTKAWDTVFAEIMGSPKRDRKWPATGPVSGASLFMTSLGQTEECFSVSLNTGNPRQAETALLHIAQLPNQHKTPTRGTAFHYLRFFPADPWLVRWCKILGDKI